MKKPPTEAEIIDRLEALCARSEQCSFDIRRKLYAKGISGSKANEIIETLEQQKFVDDSRYARAYARDKYRFSLWGRNKIKAALAVKRIDSQTIAEALSEIDLKEYAACAVKAIRGKARMLGPLSERENREKLIRFGLSRGYESKLIFQIINKLTECSTDS